MNKSGLFSEIDKEHKKIIVNIVNYIKQKKFDLAIAQRFNQYTLHDFGHFEQVAKNASELCKAVKLTKLEKFLLLAACYCHDLGMTRTKSQIVDNVQDINLARKYHAFYSNYVINEMDVAIPDEQWREIIGRISEGHGRWDWDNPIFDDVNHVRVRLLVVLLSLADVLDLRSERRTEKEITTAEEFISLEMHSISKLHWLKHYYSKSPSISASTKLIEIGLKADVKATNEDLRNPIYDPRHALIQELIQAEVKYVLQHPTFKKYASEYFNIKLKQGNSLWPCNVEITVNQNKFLFPENYVQHVYDHNMVGERSINIKTKKQYYGIPFTSFVNKNDIQYSFNVKPLSFQAEDVRSKLGYRTKLSSKMDVIFWSTEKYLDSIYGGGNIPVKANICGRIKSILEELARIKNKDTSKVYVEASDFDFPSPVTCTKNICKKFYRSDNNGTTILSGGKIEFKNHEQRNLYNSLAERFRKLTFVDLNSTKDLKKLTDYYSYILSLVPISRVIKYHLDYIGKNYCRKTLKGNKGILEEILKDGEYASRVFGCISNLTFYQRNLEIRDFDDLRLLDKYSFLAPWKYHKTSQTTLLSNNKYNFVLTSEDTIVGYIFAEIRKIKSTQFVYIRKMVVHPLMRNRGVGTMLLELIEEQTNFNIRLRVRKTNINAIALYEYFGFKKRRTIKSGYYKIYNEPEDLIAFEYEYQKTENKR